MNASDIAKFIPTRQSLLSRLKNCDDQESWRHFFETYWGLIYNAARKAGLTDAEAQDVVQETVISVSKSMPNFVYDRQKGSFKNWLLKLTRWRIVDQFRKRQRQISDIDQSFDESTGTSGIEQLADPLGLKLECLWNEEWESNLLDAAIERVKKKVEPEHYQIFDLYVMKKWSVIKVTRIMGINPGKVYLIKHRIGNLVKKEIEHLRDRPI